MSEDAGYAERFFCALFAKAVKPISDLRLLISGLCALLLALSVPAEAQKPGKVYRIGYLSASPVNETLRQSLRELGYVDGKNLNIEYRHAKRVEQYPSLATELVSLKVDLIFAVGTPAAHAAKNATGTIPIVMGNSSADPVRQGLVESLAQPGGNITGVFDVMSDLAGKRLELLKETFPKLSRVAHLSARNVIPAVAHLKRSETAARTLGLQLESLEVTSPADLENVFRTAVDRGAEALVVTGVDFFIPHLERIVNLEIKSGLPAMHTHGRWVPNGGLMSYTTDSSARYRRAAEYVVKILKGRKPSDLPVEGPTTFLLEINLNTAKKIGVTIPPNVLVRANRVIR